jgi:hypothetical protein
MIRHMRYHRNKNRQSRGLIILEADPDSGVVSIGWSLCCKDDKFSKERAKFIAQNRVAAGRIKYNFKDYSPEFITSLIYNNSNSEKMRTSSVPHSMRHTLEQIVADVNHHCFKLKERTNVVAR